MNTQLDQSTDPPLSSRIFCVGIILDYVIIHYCPCCAKKEVNDCDTGFVSITEILSYEQLSSV